MGGLSDWRVVRVERGGLSDWRVVRGGLSDWRVVRVVRGGLSDWRVVRVVRVVITALSDTFLCPVVLVLHVSPSGNGHNVPNIRCMCQVVP